MTLISFSDAAKIYYCGVKFQIYKFDVSHPLFKKFCFELRSFEKNLSLLAQDDYWKPFLSALKKYRFELSAAPLPFNWGNINPPIIHQLRNSISTCAQVYPSFAKPASYLLDLVESLCLDSTNPLLNIFIANLPSSSSVTLLIKESRLIPQVEKILSQQPNLHSQVISYSQLAGSKTFDEIHYFGAVRWLPSLVYNAPRTSKFNVYQYEWIYDKLETNTAFIYPVEAGKLSKPEEIELDYNTQKNNSGNYLHPSDYLPQIDYNDLIAIASKQSPSNLYDEEVEAKVFLLESDLAVLLEQSILNNILVIDLDGDNNQTDESSSKVKKISSLGIEPGMFILLRTEGSSDYIVPVAEKILGGQAQSILQKERTWKKCFRAYANQRGMVGLINDLRKQGCTQATEQNIRNWLSDRNIRPQEDVNFLAILKLCLLDKNSTEFFNAAAKIREAHRLAGHEIRRLLIKQVLNADLSVLEQLGRMEFTLSEAGGGSLTAFRVEEIAPDIVTVPLSATGFAFERNS